MGRTSIIPVLFTTLIAVALTFCSCTDEPSGPTPPVMPDITTHHFVWDRTQIGHKFTALYNVEGMSENDAWVCGNIWFPNTNTYDSLGNWIRPYNAAHWDGDEWSYLRIEWPSDSPLGLRPIYAIKAFARDDVWFFTGGGLAQWDGSEFRYWMAPDEFTNGKGMHHMEGTQGDLYFAGYKGSLIHFDGTRFTSLNSSTDQDINDMCFVNGEVMAIANNLDDLSHPKPVILKIQNNAITHWYDSLMYEGVTSLWFSDPDFGFICGPSLRRYENGTWTVVQLPKTLFFHYLRGTAKNDIFLAGNQGLLYHYNGSDWKYIPDFYTGGAYLKPHGMSYKNGNVWTVWTDAAFRTFVTHGRRVTQ